MTIHGRDKGGRRRDFDEEYHLNAADQRIKHLEGEAVHVGHRQHRDDAVAMIRRDHALGVVYHHREATVAEHDALRRARRSGGVVDHGEVFVVVGRERDIVRAVPVGVGLGEDGVPSCEGVGRHLVVSGDDGPVVDGYDRPQGRCLGDIEGRGRVFVGEEQQAPGVVHEVDDVLGREVREDGDGYGAVCDYAKVGLGPGGAVARAKRDVVATPDSRRAERESRLLD